MLKHKRSLSESKTTDGISLTCSANHYVGRTRFNSGTDSNTSGVSSYESVFGVGMSDLCKTLSPIPSSSNLLEVKKPNERFRRFSLTGASFRDSTISRQYAEGTTKLRSIRRHQRPMFSESAADDLAEIIDNNIRATKKINIGQQQRKLKVRSLDRHSGLVSMEVGGIHDASHSSDATVPYTCATYTRGPCYIGICMPKNIFDLFPGKTANETYVSRCLPDVDLTELSSTTRQIDFISECEESSVSSLSDISSTTSRRSKTNTTNKHNRNQCVLCCRAAFSTSIPSFKDFRLNNSIIPNSASIGAAMGGNGIIDEVDGASAALLTPHRHFEQKNSISMLPLAASDVLLSSPDNGQNEENTNEKMNVMVLRNVQRMANPVWCKQSKMTLFKMKQRHPSIFQDACLYSEVCKAISRNSYRSSARRFLQEMFYDVDYSKFYIEAADLIKAKETTRMSNDSISCDLCSNQQSDGSLQINSASEFDKSKLVNNCTAATCFVPPIVTYSIKTHLLRSPPLASVHETSRENLSESFGTNTNKSATNSVTHSNGCDVGVVDNRSSLEFMSSNLVALASSANKTSSVADDKTSTVATEVTYRRTGDFSRPRFNTLELDLSCTKNKFPISERRKTFDSSTSVSNSALFSQRITKSLSSSITTPTNLNLYCEKRLQTAKSEAMLTNNVRPSSTYSFSSSSQHSITPTTPTDRLNVSFNN